MGAIDRIGAAVGLLLCCAALSAAGPGEKDAVAMAERGAAYLKQHGQARMIERINARDPAFNRGSLYLAMRDLQGITLAHPTTALIGKNLLDVPDADGKPFRHEMVAIANGPGKGWVDYKFRNPETGKVQAKTTYVLRVGDVALEAGVYKR
jgi:cytochrome c